MKSNRKLSRDEKIRRFALATSVRPKGRIFKPSEEEERELEAFHERARLLDQAQMMTGPGFYIDRKFREFVREYNGRVFAAYGSEQPESFNILRDFVEPDDKSLVLKILPESHYSLSLDFVLDGLTDPSKARVPSDLMSLEEARIYSISIPSGYEELQFSGIEELAIFGWSFVRHGDELSILSLGAKKTPDEVQEPVDIASIERLASRPFLPDSGKMDISFDSFYDILGLYPVIFLARLDLTRGTTLVRCILNERKDSFEIHSDNREIFTFLVKGPFAKSPEEASVFFDRANHALTEHADMFGLLTVLPHIILGLDESDELQVVRAPTELHLNRSKTNVRRMKKTLSPLEAESFVQVSTIILPLRAEVDRHIDAVGYRIEQRGYWKNLQPDQAGLGKNGDRIFGKTWVDVRESWQEAFGFSPTESSKQVIVRTGIGSDNVGEVYVMRSAQHPKDVYKVGFTLKTADGRAEQLQSTSGQPDQFSVVQTWAVKDPRQVEGLVHQRLKAYRVNPKREFFHVKYPKIRAIIESTIEELDASAE